jgi:phage recombination protein Bet
MQKPVHVMPMNVKNPMSGQKEWRDVVMAGVGSYRITAARSGSYGGADAPVLGPMVTAKFQSKYNGQIEVTYPEWAEVTMHKIVGDRLVSFTAREYWLENYATESNASTCPNAMWKKRPIGQLCKCAEAQALRKGWPEVGQAPTAEEMEGKGERDITDDVTEKPTFSVVVGKPTEAEAPETEIGPYSDEDFDKNFPAWKATIEKGPRTADNFIAALEKRGVKLTDAQKTTIKDIKIGAAK